MIIAAVACRFLILDNSSGVSRILPTDSGCSPLGPWLNTLPDREVSNSLGSAASAAPVAAMPNKPATTIESTLFHLFFIVVFSLNDAACACMPSGYYYFRQRGRTHPDPRILA